MSHNQKDHTLEESATRQSLFAHDTAQSAHNESLTLYFAECHAEALRAARTAHKECLPLRKV